MKKLFLGLFLSINLGMLQAQDAQVTCQVQATTTVTTLPLMESEVFHLINQRRKANGLQLLKWSSLPAHYARLHSKNMAAGLVPFGHQGADSRFAAIRAGVPYVTRFAENVAYNFGYPNPGEVAVNGWIASPGHYANIMGDYNFAGVGVAKNEKGEHYFTQIFIKTNPPSLSAECDECAPELKASIYDNPIHLEIE